MATVGKLDKTYTPAQYWIIKKKAVTPQDLTINKMVNYHKSDAKNMKAYAPKLLTKITNFYCCVRFYRVKCSSLEFLSSQLINYHLSQNL
jgi:hypothetical protein